MNAGCGVPRIIFMLPTYGNLSGQNLQRWALRWRRGAVIHDSVISVMFVKE